MFIELLPCIGPCPVLGAEGTKTKPALCEPQKDHFQGPGNLGLKTDTRVLMDDGFYPVILRKAFSGFLLPSGHSPVASLGCRRSQCYSNLCPYSSPPTFRRIELIPVDPGSRFRGLRAHLLLCIGLPVPEHSAWPPGVLFQISSPLRLFPWALQQPCVPSPGAYPSRGPAPASLHDDLSSPGH